LDILTIALCVSIGTGVPWLIAVYAENRARQLLGNSVFGLAGAALAALAFDRIAPDYRVIALVSVGPVAAYLAILAGQAARRAIAARFPGGAP